MRLFLLVFVFLFFTSKNVVSQSVLPDQAWIKTGRVQAKINNKGALVTDFWVPNEDDDGDSLISTVGEISIWMGGIDPAGNPYLAIQRGDTATSDFQGGFRGLLGSLGVWKVTKEEIDLHIQDFEEDGDVDVKIPSIYSWPGRKNPHSQQLNGFPMDSFLFIAAPFADKNEDDNYDPDLGDFPFIDYVIYNIERVPDEIVYAPFRTKGTVPMKIDCSAVFFAYDCDNAAFLEDAVFGYINIMNTGPVRFDSFFLAFYIDGNIGQPTDDYMGTLYNSVYFYNADATDENGFESNPPVFGFHSFGDLLNASGMHSGVNSILPVYPVPSNMLPGMLAPQTPVEYYRYITGYWRDGSPLLLGGDGYQPPGQSTAFIFSGNPAISGEWSEFDENNLPGDRQALLSNGPVTMEPQSLNRLLFTLENVAGNGIGQQVEALKNYISTQSDFFYGDYFPPDISPFDSILCLNTIATAHPFAVPTYLFPNPASTYITLSAKGFELQKIVLFDMTGKIAIVIDDLPIGSHEIRLPIANLPVGIYFLQWTFRNGRRGSGKVILKQ